MSVKNDIDWELAEKLYRANNMTLRQIADQVGVSHVAIGKKAKAQGWTKDLAQKIARRAKELVNKREVTKAGYQDSLQHGRKLDDAIVEVRATVVADAIAQATRDVSDAEEVARKLMEGLKSLAFNPGMFDELARLIIEASSGGSFDEELFNAAKKAAHGAASIPGMVDTLKKLVEIRKINVDIKWRVLGIDEESNKGESPIDSIIKRVAELKRNGIGIGAHSD